MEMIKRLLKLLDDEEDGHNAIQQTISQLKKGVDDINDQLTQITESTLTYHLKLEAFRVQHTEHLKKAQVHYKRKQESQALLHFKKVKILEDQIAEYETLVRSVEQSKNKLFSRKNQLELKVDQLTAQLKMGEITADTSQIQAEVMEHLMLLENSGELARFDDITLQAESKVEALQEMTGHDRHEHELDSDEDLGRVLKSFQDQQSNDTLSNAKKKYAAFFEAENPQTSIPDQKALLLKQLKESVDCTEDKIMTFFTSDSNPNAEQHDRIKDFFGD